MGQQRFNHDVAIIGTGFSGIGAAIALKREGVSDFVLLEKAGDIGGTWRDNQYPGACCDVPSHLYSFSFELNPAWSRRFSPAAEIFEYQRQVFDQHGLDVRVRTNFEVNSADYASGGWLLTSSDGENLRVRYLVTATGALHIPFKPEIPGLDRFSGALMHSAEWNHDHNPAGKRVIVIGSAASAVQIIPELAEVASHLTVMQRTANYILPRRDRQITRFEHWLFRSVPAVQRLARWRQYLVNDFLFHPTFMNRFSLARSLVRWLVHRHMRKQVGTPELLEKLTPSYAMGCKRILLSDNYLPALQRENVDLVTDSIERFNEAGLQTTSGAQIDADLVVLATGFQTGQLSGNIRISGPGGQTLEAAWSDGIQAHRSVAVSGFPNLFLMFGPNSGLGHSSIIIMIEQQARYIARLLRMGLDRGAPTIAVRSEAEVAYNQVIQKALKDTVWSSGCDSWYKDEEGRIFTLWPHTTTRFIREMRKLHPVEFRFCKDEPEQ